VTNEEPAIPAPSSDRPDRGLIASEQHRQVMQAIRSLPPIYREPFVLKHLEGWSYAEIGRVLNLPVDTVETRLIRARRMLRESLQGLS
jgi:RNA polymerase sigma-70 factor (ECF subfamily)